MHQQLEVVQSEADAVREQLQLMQEEAAGVREQLRVAHEEARAASYVRETEVSTAPVLDSLQVRLGFQLSTACVTSSPCPCLSLCTCIQKV